MNICMCRWRYCTQSTIRKIYISSNKKHCTKDCSNCYPLCWVHDTFTDKWASFLCTLAVYCANNELQIITFFTGGSVFSSRGGSGWLANMPDYKSSGQGSTPWHSTVEGCFFRGVPPSQQLHRVVSACLTFTCTACAKIVAHIKHPTSVFR